MMETNSEVMASPQKEQGPEGVEAFVELTDYPGYWLDLERREVWWRGIATWYLRKPRGGYVNLCKEGAYKKYATYEIFGLLKRGMTWAEKMAAMPTRVEKKVQKATEVEEPEDKASLVALEEFPQYFLDMKRLELWSYQAGPAWRIPKWHKMAVGANGGVTLVKDGVHRALRFGKLVASVRLGVSYDRLPRQFSFGICGAGGELKILSRIPVGETIDKAALNARIHAMVRDESHKRRVERAKRGIEQLQLLLKAFEGDAGPLIEHVAASFELYSRRILAGRYHTKDDIQDAYDSAFYALVRQLERTDSRLYDIDLFMLKHMRYYLANLPKRTSWEDWMSRWASGEPET